MQVVISPIPSVEGSLLAVSDNMFVHNNSKVNGCCRSGFARIRVFFKGQIRSDPDTVIFLEGQIRIRVNSTRICYSSLIYLNNISIIVTFNRNKFRVNFRKTRRNNRYVINPLIILNIKQYILYLIVLWQQDIFPINYFPNG